MSGFSRLGAAIVTSSLALAGMARADMVEKLGPGEGALAIVAWAGYVERGDSDKSADWVTGFEKETGCKVTVKIAGSSDEMVSLMNGGGFDLVTASGDASLRLVAGKTVQEVNVGLVPSWGKVDPRLQDGAWHTVKGKHYGIPYQWGSNVLMYNTKVFPTPPDSWKVVFEPENLPDGKPNKGRVQAFYGPIYVADAALYLKHTHPELGITDPYELDQKQFDAAIALLKGQRQIVQKYWSDATQQTQDFTSEGVVAAPSWPYQVNLLQGQKQPIASTVPVEGATGWADTLMMHAKAPHPNCAYMWMEHALQPQVQTAIAGWFGSVPVTTNACTGDATAMCEANGVANFDKISFWKTPIADCGDGRTCVPYKDWTAAFLAIQSGQ